MASNYCEYYDAALLGAMRDAVELSENHPEVVKKAIRRCTGEGCWVYVFATAKNNRVTSTGTEIPFLCKKDSSTSR